MFRGIRENGRGRFVGQSGRQRASETELLIDIFEQDDTGIGGQAAPIAVECNGFAPNRGENQRCRVTLRRQISLHRIAAWDRVCFGATSVHVGSLLKL